MTSGRKRLLASVLVASAVAGCGSSSSSPSTTLPTPGPSTTGSTSQSPTQGSTGSSALAGEASSIREALQSGVDAHVFPGAVVVLRRGGRSRTVAVGRADVAGDVPMSPADRFRMASVTKSFTAAAALQLVARGRLSLSDTVAKWEPGLLARGADITVAELLGQTSGLPAFQSTDAFSRMRGQPTPRELVALVARAPLMFEPGSRSWYSNTNYMVLGLILQDVTHQPLNTLLQHGIEGPLGLRSASLAATRAHTPPLAHGYDAGKDVTLTSADVTWLWAAGGLVANAGDVSRFYAALFAGKVVPDALVKRMRVQRPETNHTLPFSGYGLGIGTIPTGCGTAYGHSGEAPGFIVHAWTTQDGSRSVVMAVNATINVAVNDYVVTVLNQALCDR